MQAVLYDSIDVFFRVLYILIFVRILLSWFPGGRSLGVTGVIYSLTEPILGPIRSMLQASPIGGGMMLDFSPVMALFVMDIIEVVLKGIVTLF